MTFAPSCNHRHTLIATLCGMFMLVGMTEVTRAAVIVDFNDFSEGSPNNQTGGIGFADGSDWGGSATVQIVPGDLSSSNYSLTQSGTGQSLQGTYTAPRHTNRELETALTGEVWFSFLVNLPEENSRGGIVFNPTSSNGTGNAYSVFMIGLDKLRVTIGQSTGNNIDAAISTSAGQTHLVVGVLDTDAQTLKAWFNPNLLTNPNLTSLTPDIDTGIMEENPITSITKVGAMSWGGSGIGGIVDHLRLSNDYTEVTGAVIPEPASLVLMGLGAVAVFRRRRRD